MLILLSKKYVRSMTPNGISSGKYHQINISQNGYDNHYTQKN